MLRVMINNGSDITMLITIINNKYRIIIVVAAG